MTSSTLPDGFSILLTCEKVRMAASGAGPCMPDEEFNTALELLMSVVKTWSPSICSRYERYDGAVLELVKATIAEATS